MNDTVTTLTARNADFAQHSFVPGASMMPALKTMVIGCADPRVDPAHVLGLANGDALVIRNIGGRYTPATLQTMATLRMIAQAEGAAPGPGFNLIVLQHTTAVSPASADIPISWRPRSASTRPISRPRPSVIPAPPSPSMSQLSRTILSCLLTSSCPASSTTCTRGSSRRSSHRRCGKAPRHEPGVRTVPAEPHPARHCQLPGR